MEGSPGKYILDKFQEHLQTSFENFCTRHEIEKTPGQLVTFLIDQQLIAPSQLQRYTVIREFEKIQAEYKYPKTQVVGTLASRFFISERTVWSALKYHTATKNKSFFKSSTTLND